MACVLCPEVMSPVLASGQAGLASPQIPEQVSGVAEEGSPEKEMEYNMVGRARGR